MEQTQKVNGWTDESPDRGHDIICVFDGRIKIRKAFAQQKLLCAKASHIFSTKNIGVLEILTFEILTEC